MYKLFLVEDEIVTREGIRDAVDWGEAGFEFAGDAPDGEAALPLILEARPDIVITDIKMPFMDGLELTGILREQMPELKVLILSGHDEFEFAKKAIPLEVSDYLLKPITREELLTALHNVARQLDRERQEQAHLHDLLAKLQSQQELLQEKLLLRLVTGGIDATDAVEQSQRLHVNIVAAGYLVMLLHFEVSGGPAADYTRYHDLRLAAVSAVNKNPDVLWFYKDLDELILIIKGGPHSPLAEEAQFLSRLITDTLSTDSDCVVHIGIGSRCERLTSLPESYAAAQQVLARGGSSTFEAGKTPLTDFPLLSRESIERFLHVETSGEFDAFFDQTIVPLRDAIENSQVYRNYVFTHVVFTCGSFIKQMGGNAFHVLKDLDYLEDRLSDLDGFSDFKTRLMDVVVAALDFRDAQVVNLHSSLVWEAKAFLRDNFHNPDISLQMVADHIGMSASHFSRVFSQEEGQTYVEYLTALRIERAEELLCTTNLRAYQIAENVGYNDPHYFSAVFKRITDFTPSEYRERRRPFAAKSPEPEPAS
jgi:two-component system response regulator YesN